jgi:hypothetical protein
VVGAHRGELAFGEAVVGGLDPGRYQVLRIPAGISGRRPTPHERADYLWRHRELYAQILEHLGPSRRLLVDIHTGLDAAGCAADVLCARPEMLACMAGRQSPPDGSPAAPVRMVQLVDEEAQPAPASGPAPPWPMARPDIPEAVWNRAPPLYVGLEVYLREEGEGNEAEQALGRALLEAVADCVLGPAPAPA